MTDHSIKMARARKLSRIGDNPSTFAAMARYVPARILERASAVEIAATVDALHACAQEAKAIAHRDVIDDGFVWDDRAACHREIAS